MSLQLSKNETQSLSVSIPFHFFGSPQSFPDLILLSRMRGQHIDVKKIILPLVQKWLRVDQRIILWQEVVFDTSYQFLGSERPLESVLHFVARPNDDRIRRGRGQPLEILFHVAGPILIGKNDWTREGGTLAVEPAFEI